MGDSRTDEELDMLELAFDLLCDIVDAWECDKPLFVQAHLEKQLIARKIAKAQKYLYSTYQSKR